MSVLIYYHSDQLAPRGGPAGYLYNLRLGLGDHSPVSFLPDLPMSSLQWQQKVKKWPGNIRDFAAALHHKKMYSDLLDDTGDHRSLYESTFDKYDMIHFHSTYTMFRVRDSLRDYRGQVLLTSHCPQPLHTEIKDKFTHWDKLLLKKEMNLLEKMDRYAFNRADYIIFPCQQAEQPYQKNWAYYSTFREKNAFKYRYLLTGTAPRPVCISRREFRRLHQIPEDAFVICYIGRHNAVKGYTDLKIMGNTLLSRSSKFYFLIAGHQGPEFGLDHVRWREMGWTDDPGSLIAASDCFVLPNRETYFDLILLEALSIGTCIVAANTGGNQYFSSFSEDGIFTYDTIAHAVEQMEQLSRIPAEKRNLFKQKSRLLYERCFSAEKFAENYLSLIYHLQKETE